MDRQILNITANEQILTCDNPIKISTNKVNYIEARFDLGQNWTGYDSIRAVWFNDFYCISTVLDSQGVCFVPSEVMKRNGKVKVNLVGSISENDVLTDRLTSYPIVAVIVDCTAQINGAETAPITPSQFEQYVAIVRDLVDSVKDIDHIELNSDYTLTIYYSDGTSDTTGSVRGADGNGIESVTKTGTSGLVDTYTITFTDGQTTTFNVTNGAKGDTGNGIASIEKTSTVGLVDTYTITYTNGNTTTFTVTNGEKGDKGEQGEAGGGAVGTVASAYSTSKTYAVGDYVIHNSNLYRCTTAITTAEAFNSAHWTQVVLGDDVTDLKSDISEYDAEFKNEEWVTKKVQTDSSITVDVYNNRSCQTSTNMLTLAASSGYYSYSFVAPKRLIVAGNVISGYYCIGTLLNPITDHWYEDSGGTLYQTGTSPTRYRTSDNNLPTQSSPLTIEAGTLVVVTVNSSSVPDIDVFINEFIDVAVKSDITDAVDELLDVGEAFVGCNLDNTTKFTIDKKTGRSGSTATVGGYPAVYLDAYDDYCSYCFTANEEIKIAGMPEANTYYAITTLTDPMYSSWQTSGTVLWNSGSASSRVRKSENNLPTESSPLTISAGTIVVVTVKTGEVAYLLIEETVKNSIKEPLMGEISPYIDVEMHNGYFYYYVSTRSGKYLRYKFVHFVDAPSNADGWVQRVVDLVPSNKIGTLMSVVRDGEWEMAIMLKDRPDFIGTMNHGSEIATIANLYFDGVKTTVTDGTKLSCKEIRVNQKSTMYDPDDETTVVGYHYKTHFITADGVRIEQRIEWVTNQTLGISYCGMLPATRGNDYTSSVQVTDHAYDNKTYTEYDCSTTSFDPYLSAFTDKGNVFYLRGEASDISMSIECDMENRPSEAFTFLSNAVYYNKVYCAHNNANYQVHSGDVWEWVSKYKIEYTGN